MNKLYIFISLCLVWQLVNINVLHAQAPEVLWAQKSTGTGGLDVKEQGRQVANDAAGNAYVAGIFEKSIIIGNTTLTNHRGQYAIYLAKYDADGVVQWAKKIETGLMNISMGLDVDARGNLYLISSFNGTADFEQVQLKGIVGDNIFVAKYDTDGQVQWAQRAGTAEGNIGYQHYGRGIATDHSGNVYVTGSFRVSITFGNTTLTTEGDQDIFLAKYNASGELQWVNQAGGDDIDAGEDMAVDEAGNIYVTGIFSSTATFGDKSLTSTQSVNVFLAKYDAAGSVQWVKQRDGYSNNAVAVDASGNSYITGNKSLAKYDATGELQWNKEMNNINLGGGTNNQGGIDIALDDSGNAYVAGLYAGPAAFGSTTLNTYGSYDAFVAKYSPDGSVLWARRAGGTKDDRAHGISVDASGNAYVVGFFQEKSSFGNSSLTSSGVYDAFLVKYNTSGTAQWSQNPKGLVQEGVGNSTVVDDYGNVYVTGTFMGSASFGDHDEVVGGGQDIFIAKYSAAGALLWVQRAGGPESDYVRSLALDKSGNVYITGYFSGSASFGDTTITVLNKEMWSISAFIAKYDAWGNVQWVRQYGGTKISAAGMSITLDDDDNLYLAGMFTGTIQIGSTSLTTNGNYDVMVAKFDAEGELLWAKRAGGTHLDYSHNIKVDKAGNVYLLGNFREAATFDDITLTGSGNYSYTFIAKYDAFGKVQWAKKGEVANPDYKGDIAIDETGNLVVVGNFGGSEFFGDILLRGKGYSDIYIAKYTPTGDVLWAKGIGAEGTDKGLGVTLDDAGNVYVTGMYEETATFGSSTLISKGSLDIFIAKFDASGTLLWAKSAGGAQADQGNGIAVDGIGNLYVTGYFRGDATFDNITLSSFGREMVVLKIGEAVDASNAPSGITLNGNSIDENNEEGVLIGTFHSADPANSMRFTYTFAAGEGDTDNGAFKIEGNELKAKQVFDYETKNSFSIRVQVINIWGLTYETVKTITINNVEETVTGIADEKNELLKVFPNPANQKLFISLDRTIEDVKLVSSLGATVLTKRGGAEQITLHLESLPSGIYTVVISSKGRVYARRIVVVR
ncbi:SBBP repeat-containing protein [Pontibacter anaerobius]|uniref:SBBP repeat-containing protein n=1 Tax=Pontibacter anaerobius TaxID=2993940 RepID=A0ABT3RCC5_9BACT|nr:SBBP repeat-containing protein [Pontibacter anaerobius]MCX2739068.1 SBBP repeat-containing protein [Pontibacter anaerobius]